MCLFQLKYFKILTTDILFLLYIARDITLNLTHHSSSLAIKSRQTSRDVSANSRAARSPRWSTRSKLD